MDPSETCFSRFLAIDRYLGILCYLFLCILFVSIKSKLLKSQNSRIQILQRNGCCYERGEREFERMNVSQLIYLFMSKHYILLNNCL